MAGAAQAAATQVDGLIVQLRDAPTHAALMRERAQAVGAATALSAREGERWQRVLGAAPGMRLRARDPVMISAQLLRFEQPLARDVADTMAAQLAARPEVAWAVPNTRERRLANAPNDPEFSQQWWAQIVSGSDGLPVDRRLRGVAGFMTAWTTGNVTGTAGARVAVLDSGVVKSHPELTGRLAAGYDMVSEDAYANDADPGRDADPSDPGDWVDASDIARDPGHFKSCAVEPSKWHGTAIAGIIGALANNNAGMAGIDWSGTVVPVRVAGKCGASVSDIVDGMRWAAGATDVCKRSDGNGGCFETAPRNPNPVRVINISFGGDGKCDPYQQAIDELKAQGVVVVAAAGNEHTSPTRPAKCPGVVGVVSVNRDGFKSNYSNFGAALTGSGIATVGGDDMDLEARWNTLADSGIRSLTNSGDTVPLAQGNVYDNYWGTSFAAPQVAGAISLMLSVDPNLTYDQIVQGLRVSARPHVTSPVPGMNACSESNPGRCLCTTQTCGAGILDVVQALAYAANPAGYTSTRMAESIDSTELRAAVALGPDRPPNPVTPPPDSGGGGGAMSAVWLAGLALAALLLARRRRSA